MNFPDDIVLDSLMSGNELDDSQDDPPDEQRKDRIMVCACVYMYEKYVKSVKRVFHSPFFHRTS